MENLYANIPLQETINIAKNLIHTNNSNLKIDKKHLYQLFLIATSETHVLFDDNYFDQVDGVSMGSPLALVRSVLSFLDVIVKKSSGTCVTSVYNKKTHTGFNKFS